MTDWWAECGEGDGPAVRTNIAAMVRAQNDLYMVNANAEENSNRDNLAQSLANGAISRGELQRCAENICRFLLKSPALSRLRGQETRMDRELSEAPSFDSGSAHPVEADEEGIARLDTGLIGLKKGDNTIFGLRFRKSGVYKLQMVLRSIDSNDISQLPLSVFRGSNLLGTVTLSGAQRQWQTVEMDITMGSPNFYLRFFSAQTGLEMKSCTVRFVKEKG